MFLYVPTFAKLLFSGGIYHALSQIYPSIRKNLKDAAIGQTFVLSFIPYKNLNFD